MRGGRLRHKVSIERLSSGVSVDGEPLDDWAEIAIRWASIEPLNGREFFAASGEGSEVNVRVRMRHDSITKTITSADRLIYGDLNLNIEAVINDREMNRELILMCSDRTD